MNQSYELISAHNCFINIYFGIMIIDLITVLLVVLGFYQGYRKGLIKTVFATLSLLIGIIAALKLSPIVIGILQNLLSWNPAITFVLGFVLTFILVMMLIRFLGDKLEALLRSLHIGVINKLAGGLLLSLFYAILISFGVFFMDKIELISPDQKAASFTYPFLEPLPEMTKSVGRSLQPVFSEFWDKMIETMDALKEKGEEIEVGGTTEQ